MSQFISEERLLLIAGPCQIESRDLALKTAEFLKNLEDKYPIKVVYKSSFDKANRTSASGIRGVGRDAGLAILSEVKQEMGLPVLTDIHSVEDVIACSNVIDIVQIPAFLCRQTDILVAAGAHAKCVNIKKGQFLHPADMEYVAEKVRSGGNAEIFLCERGSCFGYRDLVVDMRGLVIMRNLRFPVIFDATHSVQSMGGAGGSSGGSREFIHPLVRAAVAVGVDGIFLECHPEPLKAPSDGASMVPLTQMEPIIRSATRLFELERSLSV
jgi:2-dehydro-3-deoxyphosphooctonate aldolase (KDO 8-P synthase)